jgi:hypothetical protein
MISRRTPSTNQLRCSRLKTMPKDRTTQLAMIAGYVNRLIAKISLPAALMRAMAPRASSITVAI